MNKEFAHQMMDKLLETGKITVSYSTFKSLVNEIEFINEVDFDIKIRDIKVTLTTVEVD